MSTDGVVMRYVNSSRAGHGPLIAVASDLPRLVVDKVASMPVEWGVKGEELLRVLRAGCEKFIRAMELQGLTLIPLPQGNPLCVTDKQGHPIATPSMTFSLLEAMPDELLDNTPDAHGDTGRGPKTQREPRNLEDSRGFVDYRFIGIFWAPQVSVEIAVARDKLLAGEKAAKNPTTWGGGRTTPNKPSIAR